MGYEMSPTRTLYFSDLYGSKSCPTDLTCPTLICACVGFAILSIHSTVF